jgi:superfamily II DNA/RNA helicase
MQIKVECDKFGRSSDIKNTVVYGGAPKRSQMMDLQKGVEIVIATPGILQYNRCIHTLHCDDCHSVEQYVLCCGASFMHVMHVSVLYSS